MYAAQDAFVSALVFHKQRGVVNPREYVDKKYSKKHLQSVSLFRHESNEILYF